MIAIKLLISLFVGASLVAFSIKQMSYFRKEKSDQIGEGKLQERDVSNRLFDLRYWSSTLAILSFPGIVIGLEYDMEEVKVLFLVSALFFFCIFLGCLFREAMSGKR